MSPFHQKYAESSRILFLPTKNNQKMTTKNPSKFIAEGPN
jgi:hypothetical protein